MLDSIPPAFIPLIILAFFLALTIFFVCDRKRKCINGRAKFDIFINTCIFSYGLIAILYVFVLFTSVILFPSIKLNDVHNFLNLILWFAVLGFVVTYRYKLTGEELTKQKLFSALVFGIDFIFIFGAGVILFFIISSSLRIQFGFLPTYSPFLNAQLPTLFFIFVYFAGYLIFKLLALPLFAHRTNLLLKPPFSQLPRHWQVNKNHLLLGLSILAIVCLFLFVWLINSTYNLQILDQKAWFEGGFFYLPNLSNLTITTVYKLNLTHAGLSTDIPLELAADEKVNNDIAHTFAASDTIYWVNKSQFKNNELIISTVRYSPIVPYFIYSQPLTYKDENSSTVFLSFNFTGLDVSSNEFFIMNSGRNCWNITVNTTAHFLESPRPTLFYFYTGDYVNRYDRSRTNQYRINFDSQNNITYFAFDVLNPENISFEITCSFIPPLENLTSN